MRRIILASAAALAGAVTFAASEGRAQGDLNPSPYQTRTEQLGEVRKIRVEGPFKVLVISGSPDDSSVSLFGPPQLLADASARVEDGVLVIAFRDGANWSWNPGSGMHANITVPMLESVEIEGAATVETIGGGSPVPSFAATVNGAGRIKVSNIDAQSVRLALGGAGTIDIDGKASEVAYALGGAGTIDAKRLRAQSGTIALGGAGSIYADISGAAQIDVGGAGRVEVVGGADCTIRAPRPSQAECR